MKKNFISKALVIGITILFIGASVVAAINNKVESVNVINEIETINRSTETFYPSDDTYIRQRDPNKNYGSGSLMKVRNRYGHPSHPTYWEHNLLIKFDISSIPSNAIINSAILYIYYYSWADNNPVGRDLTLHKITEDWNEATVTWNTGPSFDSTVTSSAIVPSSTGVWMSWEVTSDTQDFVSGTETNYGWQIMDEESWGDFDIPDARFRSKEYTNGEEYIPYLEIEVIEPHIAFLFGRIKNLDTGDSFSTFDAVRLRYMQFSPLSFNTYTSDEKIAVVNQILGILSTNFAVGFFSAALM